MRRSTHPNRADELLGIRMDRHDRCHSDDASICRVLEQPAGALHRQSSAIPATDPADDLDPAEVALDLNLAEKIRPHEEYHAIRARPDGTRRASR